MQQVPANGQKPNKKKQYKAKPPARQKGTTASGNRTAAYIHTNIHTQKIEPRHLERVFHAYKHTYICTYTHKCIIHTNTYTKHRAKAPGTCVS